jgi:hypothetical protein
MMDLGSKRLAVVGDRGFEVVDGNSDVVNFGELHEPIVRPRAVGNQRRRGAPCARLAPPPPYVAEYSTLWT